MWVFIKVIRRRLKGWRAAPRVLMVLKSNKSISFKKKGVNLREVTAFPVQAPISRVVMERAVKKIQVRGKAGEIKRGLTDPSQ